MPSELSGLIAATYTPMLEDGSVNVDQVAPMVDHLRRSGVSGLYVCGSTGEGISLTGAERMMVAEAYVRSSGEMPVVVQVGHNSLFEARDLAKHAQQIGADAISANAPSYFKITDVETLVSSMKEIAAAAPKLPFYYYHIPHLTGAAIDMLDFLEAASKSIPNLAGIKYTAPTAHEYQQCLEWQAGRYNVLWGSDEMLLSALAIGARGAVGSTYNFAAPLYRRVIEAFDAGNLAEAREHMSKAVQMIRTIYQYPFHSTAKAILKMQGVECGRCRLPQKGISAAQIDKLTNELTAIGFFDWSQPGA